MTYPGGKNSCYQHIINQIPPHHVYIEPFYGSGAIMRRKLPARLNIGIDIDPAVLPGVIGETVDASEETAVTPEPAMAARIAGCNEDRYSLEMTTAAPIARNDGYSCYQFIRANAIDFLSSCRFRGDEFIYLDPPYLMSARRSKRDLYRYEFGTKREHISLLNIIRSLPCMVALSGYWSELYDEMLSDWRVISFSAHTRNGMADEYLWMNYKEPMSLHDYRYLGDDFRERERIKRRAKRWVKRFSSLEVLERRAIVSELYDAGVIARNGVTAVTPEIARGGRD